MRRRRLLPLLLLLLPGCAFLKNLFADAFEKPTFTFKTARLHDASLSAITVDLVYTLDNPNPFSLSLANVDYAFFVEGKQLLAGKPREGLSLKANGQSELVFPAQVKFADLAKVTEVVLTRDTAAYRAEGTVGVKTPIGVLDFPLRKEGRFEVPKVPEIRVTSPRVTDLSLSGATVELPLELENRNSFPLPISALTGQVAIAGATVGQLSAPNVGLLQVGETRKLTVPLRISFSGALGAANALRAGEGTLSLQGSVESGGARVPFQLTDRVDFRR